MSNPTYLDVANRLGPDNKVATIIELLAQTNEVLQDMVTMEGNLPTGHKSIIRTGYPEATWRLFNYGVQPSKSQTKPVVDTTGMLEAYAEIDKDLADLNGNTAAYRLSEDRAFLESMNREMATTLFYGNVNVDPEKFTGLAPRYATISSDDENIGSNIIDGKETANLTSIWLVVWGENTVHAIYPKGSEVGFKHEDLGQQTLTDAAGGRYEGYRTHYKWDLGLVVRDWRYAVRIANVDVTKALAGTQDIVDLMIQASERIPSFDMGKAAFYMRRDVRTALRGQILTKAANNLTFDTVAGKRVLAFDEIPVRRVDALLKTESQVS